MRTLLLVPLLLALPVPARAQEVGELKRAALEAAQELRPTIDDLAIGLWRFAETGLREKRSAKLLADRLEAAGFRVERGVAGMPTAFVATWGEGKPVVGILAEYDALPGVGNQPLPEKVARTDGVTSGHGCGHNLFGAGSVGGALALKSVMEKHKVPGTIKLFGCPAEETLIGKVYMAKDGVFKGLDAVLDWHPSLKTGVKNSPSRAMNNFEVEFFGQAAHGAVDPWNGRSALDAVEMMNFGVNLMREHVKPSARIHYVIPRGGDAPNVVPAYAKVWYYVRDLDRPQVQKYYERILRIARGAAMATDTKHKVRLLTGVHEYLYNRPLQEAIHANLKRIGAPKFTEAEQAFARELQKSLARKPTGFSTKVEPLADRVVGDAGGSTDVAEVSWMVPTAGFNVASAAQDVPWHSWATTSCHGTAAARRSAHIAAKVIALTGLDILKKPALLESARADFRKKTEGKPYVPPIPKDQKPPLPED